MSMIEQRPEVAQEAIAARRGKWLLRAAIGLPLIALVWFFVIRVLVRDLRRLDWRQLDINWLFVGGTMLFLILGRLAMGLTTRHVMAALGKHLRHRQTVPILWVAAMGRYIPGKMATVAGSVVFFVKLGVGWTVTLAALSLSTAMMILVGLMAAVPMMFVHPVMRKNIPYGWAISLVMLGGGAVCLHPHVFTKICNLGLKRLKRGALPERMQWGPYSWAVFITLWRALFLGCAVWCAAEAFKPIGFGGFLLSLAAGGAASAAGFLAVYAPAGLGVHEWIYLMTVGTLIGPQGALMVIMYRVLNVISDVITWGVGMVMLKGAFVASEMEPQMNADEHG